MRSTWNAERLLLGKLLTDARIEYYRARGWYSAELREMRRERNRKRMERQALREGNFLKQDGRLIYSPL